MFHSLFISLHSFAAVAFGASDAQEAERDRLAAELMVVARREQWKGVEHHYQELLKLSAQGVPLTSDLHAMGAASALTRGDVGSALERLARAIQLGDASASQQHADLLQRFGNVNLELAQRLPRDRHLDLSPAPMSPDARRALEHATERLRATGRFIGFLPAGDYTLGTAVFYLPAGPGQSIVSIGPVKDAEPASPTRAESTDDSPAPSHHRRARDETPEQAPQSEVATAQASSHRSGFRTRVGFGLAGATSPPPAVVAPPSGVGFAPVIGAGWTHAAETIDISAIVTGRGLFDSARLGAQQLYLLTGQMMFGWRVSDVVVEAGPLYGLGGGAAQSVAATADPAACAGGACSDEGIHGRVFGGGAEAGAIIPLFANKERAASLDVHAGALYDGARAYPWLTVSLGLHSGATQ